MAGEVLKGEVMGVERGADVEVVGEAGDTVFLVIPLTPEAEEWIDENVVGETTWLGRGLAVEHRYIGDLLDGMVNDGLEVTRG